MVPAAADATRSVSASTPRRFTGSYDAHAPSAPTRTDPPPSTSRLGAVVVPSCVVWNSACRSLGNSRVVSEPVSDGMSPAPPSSS